MFDRHQEAEQAETIRRIVPGMPWPEDVKGFDVKFGANWEGDPAVRVCFLVDDHLRPSEEKVERVGRFTRDVSQARIAAELSHCPFVRLRATSPSQT
jgi:hypothetical protein